MHIAVIIVNFRTPEMVLKCLESLSKEREKFDDFSVCVVDNASGDHSVPFLTRELAGPGFSTWVQFRPLAINGGFGWGNNEAIRAAVASPRKPHAILLLNPDTIVQPGSLKALVTDLETRPDAGAVGSQLLNPDGSLAGSAFRFPSIAREFARGIGLDRIARMLGIKATLVPYGERGPVDWVTGACVLLRVDALREVGLFDTGFFLYFEEVELMWRMRRHGWLCYHCPESRIMHLEGASTGVTTAKVPADYVFASRRRFFALSGGRLKALLADLAWLAGDLLGRLVALCFPNRRRCDHALERAALLRLGLGASSRDSVRAIARIDSPSGVPPAWMD